MEASGGSTPAFSSNFKSQQGISTAAQTNPKNSLDSAKRSYASASLLRHPLLHLNQMLARWAGHWIPTSKIALESAEQKLLQNVKSPIGFKFMPVWQGRFQIWVAVLNCRRKSSSQAAKCLAGQAEKTPLVLVHGLGGGLGLWLKNYDALCQNRTVYAFDLLGFGKSSRPTFSNDPALVEQEWVQSIEDFRQDAKIDKMILLGHSLGGYLASAYAIEYPDRVRHLILADPWGFGVKTVESERTIQVPSWVRMLASIASNFNPFSALRVMGPYGNSFLRFVRPDFGRKFGDHSGGADAIFDYIYHCNVQPPSGETAFRTLTLAYGWAKRPMIDQIRFLPIEVPMTFIYGSRSWIDCTPGYEVQRQLRSDSYVRVEVISGAGHHVYVDHADVFNELVNEVCEIVDSGNDVLALGDDSDDFNVPLRLAANSIELT